MKTFEERYTAWIDGELDGPALTSFELELSRRASAGEAWADKTDAGRLRDLLKAGLQAPAMTNTEFFSHQLSERIAADRAADRRREEPRRGRSPLFAWSFGQLAGLGAACLFVAAALYYGLMPGETGAYRGTVAKTDSSPANGPAVVVEPPSPSIPAVTTPDNRANFGPIQVALRSPTPPPVNLAPADIQKVQVADQSKDTTTAIPLHYAKPDVNVIWINGLDYLPSVPDDKVADPTAVGTPSPTPVVGTAQP